MIDDALMLFYYMLFLLLSNLLIIECQLLGNDLQVWK